MMHAHAALQRVRAPSDRAMPFIRLGVAALVVLIGDLFTPLLQNSGFVINPWIVTAVRLMTAATVLRYPLAGSVLALEVDKWDWYWLGMGARSLEDQAIYQQWDKCMDLVFLAFATILLLRWPDRRLAWVALGAFSWCVLGVVTILLTRQEDMLVFFPNVIETLFLVAVLYRVLTTADVIFPSWRVALLVLGVLLVPKTAQEVFLHVMHNNRPWNVWAVTWLPIGLQAWIWGALMYAPPVLAVPYLWSMSKQRRPLPVDPEEAMAVV